MTTLAVSLRAVSKTYAGARRAALSQIDLAIPRGIVWGLVGPNGAGKTTLLSLLTGLSRADAGEISVLNERVRGRNIALLSRMGLVPQGLAFYPELTVFENLSAFGTLQGLAGRVLVSRIDEALAIGDLTTCRDQRAGVLSGGLKRRLNLAIGLLHRPELLILDEPTVGIDPQSRRLIHDTLAALRGAGTTILYTSHHLDEIERLCDCIAIIDRGRILAEGSLASLSAQARPPAIEWRADSALPAAVAAELAALPGVLSLDTRDTQVRLMADDPWRTLPEALRVLSLHAIRPRTLHIGTARLEETFLDLTRTDTQGPPEE